MCQCNRLLNLVRNVLDILGDGIATFQDSLLGVNITNKLPPGKLSGFLIPAKDEKCVHTDIYIEQPSEGIFISVIVDLI